MPELMLRYRSAAFLVRLYAPEVMLGVPTIEEVEDVAAAAPAMPARVVLTAASIPALEEAGTRGGQLAALLAEDTAPTVIDAATAPQQAAAPAAAPAPTKPAATTTPRPQPADPEQDALATRKALEGMSGRIPHAIVRAKAREALHLARMSDERYAAAIMHGAGQGWWTANTDGLLLAGAETPAPAEDRWAALAGDDLAGAIADAMQRLGDQLSGEAMTAVDMSDDELLDGPPDDHMRRLGRELDRVEAQLRLEVEG
jgi:hypothetical protein